MCKRRAKVEGRIPPPPPGAYKNDNITTEGLPYGIIPPVLHRISSEVCQRWYYPPWGPSAMGFLPGESGGAQRFTIILYLGGGGGAGLYIYIYIYIYIFKSSICT